MTNNELSKKILLTLVERADKSSKFSELVNQISADKKRIALNLFYLETNGLVELRSVYSSDALFPEIYYVALKPKGVILAENPEKLENIFPSNMDYSLQNISLILENLKTALFQWSSKEEKKKLLYQKITQAFEDPLFLDFIEEFYSGKKPR